jgi:hypothetical protein
MTLLAAALITLGGGNSPAGASPSTVQEVRTLAGLVGVAIPCTPLPSIPQ